ncbi:ShlB/FhaC/HecB family hemolysin secretion/activation protein [Ideonella benzenivorans]|uniref:ShlB/FhaC/HecB family hemolysin secretion/activation protein n=1 Tax=Ideonella benzenivorans TaxID=2831643 RepID=UPI001CED69FE|nr:ShlB/FhaC/HecB family hemolysin secretion/activation protein [Ideonella benzenivorans]
MRHPLTLSVLSLSALALSTGSALAASPDAGQLLKDLQTVPRQMPAAPSGALTIDEPALTPVAEGGPQVTVHQFRLSGVTVFPQAELQALLADGRGRPLSLAGLQALAARITQHYRQAGYLVARAYLPAQKVSGDAVEIAVVEGRLDRVTREGGADLGGDALLPLTSLQAGDVLRSDQLESVLMALRDLPGVKVSATLRPGQTVGSSELLVDVASDTTWTGGLDLDNQGSDSTGAVRAGARLAWNNPLGVGDQLSLRAQVSENAQHALMAGYQLPVGREGGRVGVAVTAMDYQLGKAFEVLDADGQASTVSVYWRQPLVRGREATVYASAQLDNKHLIDRIHSVGTRTEQHIFTPTFSLQAQWQDGWLGQSASSRASLSAQVGDVRLDATSRALDAQGARTDAGFAKLGLDAQRWQALAPAWTLMLSARAQTADNNLPSAEKMTLGGAQGVRAYPEGEASGDRGWLGTAELAWQWASGWQAVAFADAGMVQINSHAWEAGVDNRRRLAGAGLGGRWAEGPWSVSVDAAWALDHESVTITPERHPRVWARLAWQF